MILDQHGRPARQPSERLPEFAFLDKFYRECALKLLRGLRELSSQSLVDPRGNPASMPRKIGDVLHLRTPGKVAQ